MGAKKEQKRNLTSQPDIHRYHDYREYLRDWVDHKRSTQPQFSLRKMALELKTSVSLLTMILKGDRNLSKELFEKLCPYLGLSASESSYLGQLKIVSDSDSQKDRVAALKRLQRFHGYQEQNSTDLEAHKYMAKWYYVAIREMTAMPDFQADPKWIRKRLKKKVSSREIREALAFLFDHGFIERDPKTKKVTIPTKQLDCSEGIYKLSLSQFHSQMFELATDSISTTPRERRWINGHTAAITAKQFEQIREILKEGLEKIEQITDKSESGEEVYHIGLLAFPVTQNGGRENG
ncbi:MAG: TIGR02147 family protein [Bdellovibrionaceae bacterium]|nr:TIGR02147 family protein [Bdellovibrionales bacterium]MCB9084374.1 TIGR02147 family protein [Pseudobdellovibrionaceae bacterium]